MSCSLRSILAGGVLAAAVLAWPLYSSTANPYFAQQTGNQPCSACHLPGQEPAGAAGLNQTGQGFKACGELPSCFRPYPQPQYGQQPYPQQPYPQQPYYAQPYPPPQQPYYAQPYSPPQQPYYPQQPYQSGSRRFDYPRENGAIVDVCSTWAIDCGRGGADQFCHQQGFRTALSWNEFHPGQTYVVGSQKTCFGDRCRGFLFVVCG